MANYRAHAELKERDFEVHITGPGDFEATIRSTREVMLDAVRYHISYVTGEPLDKIGITLTTNIQPEEEAHGPQ